MQRIVIVGAGFAGMYAALSAARLRDERGVSPKALEIAVVAPEPRLVVRPRLYERAPETVVAPLSELFEAVDIRYEQGRVETIDCAGNSVAIIGRDGKIVAIYRSVVTQEEIKKHLDKLVAMGEREAKREQIAMAKSKSKAEASSVPS